jgi:transcriptional regulator NrdR family protein
MSACPDPNCRLLKTRVIDSRVLTNGWTKRRRECYLGCGGRWNTYEVPEDELQITNTQDQESEVEQGNEGAD